ncbi:hypothetical protein [Acinetobacter sp. YH12099]|nr:hypothetical protein [Acinetobacter sp. YH12099]
MLSPHHATTVVSDIGLIAQSVLSELQSYTYAIQCFSVELATN